NPSHYCPHAYSGMFSGGISGGLGTCSTPETNILIGKNYCRWRPLPRGLGEKALEVSSKNEGNGYEQRFGVAALLACSCAILKAAAAKILILNLLERLADGCFWQLDSAPPWPSDLAPPTS